MKTIKFVNEEIDLELETNIKDSWSEVKLKDYLKLVAIIEKRDLLNDEEFFISILEVISDAPKDKLLDIPISEFTRFTDVFNMYTTLEVKENIEDYYIIEDKIFVPKKNMSNLTTSELIYIKQIQKMESSVEIYLGMLSILLRPGFKREEDGKERWIMHRLNGDDIEERKEYFRENLSASIAIPLIMAFTNGTKE